MVQVLEVNNNNCVLEDFSGSMCPECNGSVISDSFSGDTICSICGLVVKEKEMDYTNEKNIFNNEQKNLRDRTGDPITIFNPDISFCTQIFLNDVKNHKSRFFRLVKIDLTSKRNAKKNRSLISAQKTLSRIGANLKLSNNIRELAMFFCKKAFKENIVRGKSVESMVVSCLYYACRKLSVPVSFKELVKETLYDERYIQKTYKRLISTFQLKVPLVNPNMFISRYVSELGLSFDIEKKVLTVIQKIPSIVKSGLNPIVLCASVIYLVSKMENINITQKEISRIAGITETSIRNNFRKLKQYVSNNIIITKTKLTKANLIVEELQKHDLTSIQLREKTNIPKDQIKMYLYELHKKNVIKRITDKIPFIYSL